MVQYLDENEFPYRDERLPRYNENKDLINEVENKEIVKLNDEYIELQKLLIAKKKLIDDLQQTCDHTFKLVHTEIIHNEKYYICSKCGLDVTI